MQDTLQKELETSRPVITESKPINDTELESYAAFIRPLDEPRIYALLSFVDDDYLMGEITRRIIERRNMLNAVSDIIKMD